LNKDDVLFRLKKEVSSRTNIPLNEIDLVTPFSEFGLDSMDAVGITGELSEWLDIELDATLLWEFTNIEALVDFLVVKKETPIKDDVHINPSEHSPINEPIAIVGMGSRFAGTNGLSEFWQLLCNGEDAITNPNDDYESKDVNRNLYGGYLNDIDKFDSDFFGISPREAEKMDPQHRILLETTWEAIEHAGITEEMINGSKTGVFVGISNNDYGRDLLHDNKDADIYSITGNAFSIAANRISYLFDLKGPSLSVDTACSSSLAVVHQACQSLRLGECNMAIAGGVNVALTPEITRAFDEAGMLSKDRVCKTFDEQADGYVRGEGTGIVILKTLSKAISNRDNILSVIKGSAINHNGRSNGLTAPNKSSQIQVLKEAHYNAGISPEEIQYIETHGTGTSLGDPIEVDAIGRTLNEGNTVLNCRIGSVKTNIGHLEASAGIAGLIKTCLSIKHRKLPPSLNVNKPNPLIKFDRLPIQIQTELTPWPNEEKLLIAGVSSFGFGGTNVHMVISEPPNSYTKDDIKTGNAKDNHSTNIFPISAKSSLSLSLLVEKVRNELDYSLKNESWSNMCYTAQQRRSHYRYRHAVTANSKNELKQELDDILLHPSIPKNDLPNISFVFTGQGSEWLRMGEQLYDQNQTFRETVQQCDRVFFQYAGWSIIEELFADEENSRLIYTEVVQPLIFTIQVSLARLWISLGITPSSTIGHSVGEVCAYHIAGAITLEEALFLVYHRGQSMKSTIGDGKMLALRASMDFAKQLVSEYDGIELAAHNGPKSIVLSGDNEIIKTVKEKCIEHDIKAKIINHNYAFHSNKMNSIMNEFSNSIKKITFKETDIPVFSTTTGKKANGEMLTTQYWANNVRGTVRFSESIQSSCQYGMNTFIEIGPHQVLARDILENAEDYSKKVLTLPSMRKNKDEKLTFSESLSVLYEQGLTPKWESLFNKRRGLVTSLPTYAWDRQTYWKTKKGLNESHRNNDYLLQSKIVNESEQNVLLRKEILEANDKVRQNIVIEYVREQIARVLKITNSEIDIHQPLNTIGLDSIMAIELKNKVEADLNIERVSIVKFLDGQTTLEVTDELINMVISNEGQSEEMTEYENNEEGAERIEQILDNLDHIDNDQIDRLLKKYTR